MAEFVLGGGEDPVRSEKERKEIENQEKAKRHYKKDSRYLEDLYTLTYQEDSYDREDDEEESAEDHPHDVAPFRAPLHLASLQVGGRGAKPVLTRLTLDTNLHKILARRMAEGQGVSLRSCKLLTRAYYSLLRDGQTPAHFPPPPRPRTNDPKLDWSTLLQTDGQQLANIVAGYSTLVRGLNDELMGELMRKDELSAEQDTMLETISELTDSLL